MKDKKYRVVGFWVPPHMDYDKVVEMLKFNDFKVDDMCTASRNGRLLNIWIPDEDLELTTLKEKVGRFM